MMDRSSSNSGEARTFAELFGLDESSPGSTYGRRDNPGGGRGRTAKFARGDAPPAKRGGGAKRGGAKGRAAKPKKPTRKAKPKKAAAKNCAKTKRCPPSGPRFSLRSIGRKFTGIFDRTAGTGAHRGLYVKRGDLECGSEKGASAPLTLEVLIDSELPESKKERRGPWEIWLDKSGNWLVYDARTATLEERSFLQRSQVLRYISSGRAQRDTCPPRRGAGSGMSRRDNPGDDYGLSVRDRDDDYLRGSVEGVGGGGSIERRVGLLEAKTRQLETRVTRTEGGLGRALGIIANRRSPQLD